LNCFEYEFVILFSCQVVCLLLQDLEISQESILYNVDKQIVRSLNGFRVNEQLLRLVQSKDFGINRGRQQGDIRRSLASCEGWHFFIYTHFLAFNLIEGLNGQVGLVFNIFINTLANLNLWQGIWVRWYFSLCMLPLQV